MTNQHPITPPPELVQGWYEDKTDYFIDMIRAAQWGADQELEACCEWLDDYLLAPKSDQLRAARRPKPPSLKKQALQAINAIDAGTDKPGDSDIIRRALEQLDD